MTLHVIRRLLRFIAAALFVCAGVSHFLRPDLYRQIIPPSFPAHSLLVVVSGACEIMGGVGLLIRPVRKAAAWGLVALLCAVFPANVYMAVYPQLTPGWDLPHWVLWVRLPLQFVFIAWVWFVGIARPPSRENGVNR